MPSSRYSSPGVRRVLVLVLAVFCGTNTNGAEIDVKNDSLIDGNSGTPCACFVSGESTAAWLTSPCNGDIVAVQVFWRSQFGGGPSSAETAISIFGDGAFPTPGAVLVNQDNSPAVITAPTLSDGALNKFRHLDVAQNIPLGVPISSGETFVVSLEVFNQSAGSPFTPTFVYDLDGCQANRNAVDVMPGGWFDACLVGVTGDWMIRAVVDCAEETPPEPPTQAPFPHDLAKNRYISIDRGNPGLDFFDIKLTLAGTQVNSVPGSMIDSIWWAGCPDEDCISLVGRARSATPPDWSRCRTVHLTGCPIIPTSTYEIVVVDGANESAPVYEGLTQLRPGVKWHGDCVGFFTGTEWTPPNGQTSIDDAVAAIKTFQNPSATPGCGAPPCNATHTSVTDMVPNLTPGPQINKIVNIADVFSIIQGFQGNEYSGGDIGLCPNADEPCPGPCAEAEDDTPCEDGDVCTIGDTCQEGECVSGADDCQDKEPGTKSNEFAVPFSFQKQAPTGTTGMLDPVYLFSGEFYESVVDLRIAGRGFDFVWGRKYRSRIGPSTAMGNGWDFSYNIFLEQSGSNLTVHNGDTRQDTYVLQGDGTWTRAEFFRVIEANFNPGSDPFTMTFPDTGTWNFHAFDGSPAEGKLATIVDRNGNTMRFDYDALGRLTTVHDTLDTATHNRDITIAYDASGFIASVTDFAGRSVTYAHYDGIVVDGSPGDLESVTTPPVMNTPNFPIPAGHDYLAGKKTTYTYSTGFADDRLNHNLLTITDPKGQTYLINEYDPTTDDTSLNFDRIVRQTWGNTGDLIDLVYLPQVPDASNNFAVIKTIVNDRVGNVKELSFDARNRGVFEREYTGRANPDMPTTETTNRPTGQLRPGDPPFFEARYEYSLDSLLTRRIDANGNQIDRTYDNANASRRSQANLLEACRFPGAGAGDQPRICESYEYDDGLGGGTNFMTRHVDGRGQETLHTYDANGNRLHTQHRIPSIVEDYEYNQFGQLTSHTLPDNGSPTGHRRRDEAVYYTSGPQNGYLRDTIVDAPNLGLTTTREYNLVGVVTRVIDPRGHDTQYAVNQLNQTVRRVSREVSTGGIRYERDTFYDPNDNVVRVDTQNVDDQDVLQANTHFATVLEYEILDYMTRVCTEVGDYTGPIPGTQQVPLCAGLPESQFITNEYEYDANRNRTLERGGEAVERRQPNNVVQTEYDERDLVFRIIRAPGDLDQSTTQYDYDGNRNVARTLQGLEDAPRTIANVYDGYDRLVSVVDPMGNEMTHHYDANHNRVSQRADGELVDFPGGSANNRLGETNYVYDDMDRLMRKETAFFDTDTQAPILVGPTPDGVSSTDFQWSDNLQIVLLIDDNLHQTRFAYDSANRLLSTVDPKSNRTSYTYDANSNIASITEAEKSDLGNPDQVFMTTFAYDNLDRLTQSTDNVGNTHTFDHDSRGNRTFEDDALGRDTRSVYDGYDRLIATVHDLDGDGADGDGPDITTGRTWDDTSRLTGQDDDNGNVTNYQYDALNRMVAKEFADCTQHRFTYDVHDNQLTMTDDANGNLSVCTYDALDRLATNTITPGPGVSNDTTFENYQYDGLSRLVAAQDNDSLVMRSHNSLSRVTRETLNGQITTCLFDGAGNKLDMTYPGGRTISCSYDDLNRKKSINDTTGIGQLIATYEYVGPDRVERRSYGNNTQTDLTYDGLTAIPNPPNDFGVKQIIATSHVNLSSGAIIDQRSYSWDRMDNKKQRMDNRSSGPRLTHDYEYDDIYRLVQTTVTDPTFMVLRDTTYDLDGVGNRTTVAGAPDPGPHVGTYTMDATVCVPADKQMNQYSTTAFDARLYDPNGNFIRIDSGLPTQREIKYDYRDQMVEYVVVATGERHTYAYDALGRRIVTVVDADGAATGPTETRYFYDGWQVVEELDVFGLTQATYVYGLYIDEVLNMQRGGVDFFYHTDDLYNVMAVTNAAGIVEERYEYADYGTPVDPGSLTSIAGRPSTIGNPYRFSGRRYDPETEWYYYRTRYLDPDAGRFTSRDMIGIWGDARNFGNAYSYTGGNPFSFVDPYGRAKEKFERTKPHVNVGTLVHVDHGKTNSLATFVGDHGVLNSDGGSGGGVVSDPGFGIIKSGFHSSAAEGTIKRLTDRGFGFIEPGDAAASKPPRPHFSVSTTGEPLARPKKPREIVVVGSKVKDVVRSAGFGCHWPMCGGWLSNASSGADEEAKTKGGIIIPDTAKAHGHLDYLKAPVDPSADYIKNMVTGAAGMKLIEAIIKPSKSPMPQTREHILLGRQPAVSRMKIRPLQDRILIKR